MVEHKHYFASSKMKFHNGRNFRKRYECSCTENFVQYKFKKHISSAWTTVFLKHTFIISLQFRFVSLKQLKPFGHSQLSFAYAVEFKFLREKLIFLTFSKKSKVEVRSFLWRPVRVFDARELAETQIIDMLAI